MKLRIGPLRREHIYYAALVVVGFFLIAAASQDLYSGQIEDISARSEYDRLRELFYMPSVPTDAVFQRSVADPIPDEQPEPRYPVRRYPNPDLPGAEQAEQPDPIASLIVLNPDYIGWIAIEDVLDYPVVRGHDNSFYLNVTFTGNNNPAGAIFMDYRLARGFDAPICVLYGHNMRDGSMFARLNQYLDPTFMADNHYITVTTAEGEVLIYRVFAAMRTDTWNSVYDLDFPEGAAFDGARAAAARFLILSTCTNSADRDERLLLYSSLVD